MFWAIQNTVWLKIAFKISGYPKWAEIKENSSFLIDFQIFSSKYNNIVAKVCIFQLKMQSKTQFG